MHDMFVGDQSHDRARRREDEACERTSWLLGVTGEFNGRPPTKTQQPRNCRFLFRNRHSSALKKASIVTTVRNQVFLKVPFTQPPTYGHKPPRHLGLRDLIAQPTQATRKHNHQTYGSIDGGTPASPSPSADPASAVALDLRLRRALPSAGGGPGAPGLSSIRCWGPCVFVERPSSLA